MKESMWGVLVVMLGIISVAFVIFFQNATNTDEQNYILLKEITEAAMYDAVDYAEYSATGNFVRRFAESVSIGNTYKIDIYDVSECPPKVSLEVSTSLDSNVTSEIMEFDIVNRLDAILETPY